MAEYREYIAATKFLVGQDKETSLPIEKGTPIKYNGSKAIIDGEEYIFPRLESAIKARWLIDKAELQGEVPEHRPQSANIEMRHPTDDDGESTVASTATLSEEERTVGSVEEFKNNPGGKASSSNYEVSSQAGEVVSGVSFSTPSGEKAKQQTTQMDRVSRNDIENMSPSGASKKAHFEALERQKMEREIAELKQQLAQQQPQKQVREGIQFEGHNISRQAADTTEDQGEPGGVVWDGEESPVVGQVQSGDGETESEDLSDKEARLAFARQMMPNFNWDFSAHWKTKLKSLEGQQPLYVCTVYAVETDAMKKHIASKFPELNLGG